MKHFIAGILNKFYLKGENALKLGNRSGADRRSTDPRRRRRSRKYFTNGGAEKRSHTDRRTAGERRNLWKRVSQWKSVYMG